MSRYDGLIIPRSYSEYINKTDAATLQQALQLSGVLSGAVAAGDNKAVKSSAVNAALSEYDIKYDTTVIRDFNLAIPALGKEKLYLIPANGTQQNKPDSTTVQWLLRVNRKPVQSGISNEQRVIQEAICFSGAGHEIKYFLRTATSSDNGITWEWGTWEKVVTESEISNNRGVLEKTVTINHGNNVHTVVTLNTEGTYLLHASGNNYGGYLGFVTSGYNSRTVINELYHSSISAVVSGFKTLDFTSFANGDITLSIVRF